MRIQQRKATDVINPDPRLKICPRWRSLLDFVYHPDRVKYPLKRVSERGRGDFKRVSWDEALDTIAAALQSMAEDYGPESVVFYSSETRECIAYYQRLAHAYGSPNFCSGISNCFTAAWLAAVLTYGRGYAPIVEPGNTFADTATRCKVIWGSGILHSTPHLWQEYLAIRDSGLKLIVVDPRRTKIAAMADIHPKLRPGTDGALALGMINVIINDNLYDSRFVQEWTTGFEDLKELVRKLKLGDLFWYGDLEKSLDHILEPSGNTLESLRKYPEGLENEANPHPERYYERAGFRNTRRSNTRTASLGR